MSNEHTLNAFTGKLNVIYYNGVRHNFTKKKTPNLHTVARDEFGYLEMR